ncbi:MAG: hypothetical protein HZC40_14925 [Chloroflexi bacterium]|nr:hypothetical protein [Chloroflexota bacterium]
MTNHLRPEGFASRKPFGSIVIALALISAGAYLAFAGARGFPLDDAWIHQVYARNLGTRGEFAFFAGQPSAGSTSPLWTILLSLGYILHIDFRAWAYLLGAILLAASALFAARLANQIFPPALFTVHCSLFTLFEWHLAWSAVSGMEIPLFIFLSLLLLERFFGRAHPFLLGLIGALLTLTRPEGIVLVALIFGKILFERRIRDLGFGILGFGIFLTPYLVFNLHTNGTLLPNTFYAKNVEYAILFERAPFILRWFELVSVPWVGAQMLLLPGFVFITARLIRARDWRALIPVAWIVILPALYASRLPVTYQHGRYEMPVIPFIAIYGIVGTVELFARIRLRVARRVCGATIAATLIAFWLIGANAYANDVAFIDCEMVQSARWIADSAPRDARVAAHDIGALGYLYDQPFIDLAGLVTPQVIPFLRDEGRLRDYLFSRQTTHAIFFPDWYPALARDSRFVPVFQTNCALTRELGGMNMMIYKIVP